MERIGGIVVSLTKLSGEVFEAGCFFLLSALMLPAGVESGAVGIGLTRCRLSRALVIPARVGAECTRRNASVRRARTLVRGDDFNIGPRIGSCATAINRCGTLVIQDFKLGRSRR
jgi:hypothetical protein